MAPPRPSPLWCKPVLAQLVDEAIRGQREEVREVRAGHHLPENLRGFRKLFRVTEDYHGNKFFVRRGRWRGHFYQLTADLIMLEHRPDYARATYNAIPAFRNRLRETGEEDSDAVELIAESLQHLPMYILYGWETGIYNEFRHLQSRGLSKAQLMELVLFAQLQAGIRGLQHVYNAVGKYLPQGP